jgi:nitrous oxidase accessory protein
MRYGTHFMYAHDVTVRDSRFERNVVGIFVMYSARALLERNVLGGARGPAGVGIGFKDSDAITVRDSVIVGNTAGLSLDRTPRTAATPVAVEGNVLALNEVALRLHGTSEGVRVAGNDLLDNPTPVQVEGGGDALGLVFDGNHWSDYAGYDLDGDGVGDVAHEPKRLSGELTDAHPSLRLFHGSAAMEIIDGVARAVPVLASRRLLVDARPTMRPHSPRGQGPRAPDSRPDPADGLENANKRRLR